MILGPECGPKESVLYSISEEPLNAFEHRNYEIHISGGKFWCHYIQNGLEMKKKITKAFKSSLLKSRWEGMRVQAL